METAGKQDKRPPRIIQISRGIEVYWEPPFSR
jgi:hypothetical protein